MAANAPLLNSGDMAPVATIAAPMISANDQPIAENPGFQVKSDNEGVQKRLQDYEELQKQSGGRGQEGLAFLAGVGRGSTLGTSDVGLTQSGLVNPETLAGFKKASPLASGAGELVGAGGLLALTGGLSAPAEAAAGVAGKIAAMGAEGAAFGAGNAISDAALGDPNLNAQKILAHIGTGAAFGLGLGALGELVQAGTPTIMKTLSKGLDKAKEFTVGSESAPGLLEKVAPDWANKFKLGMESGLDGKSIQSKVRETVNIFQDLYNGGKKAATALYEKAAPARLGKALENMPIEDAQAAASSTLDNIRGLSQGLSEIADESAAQSLGKTAIKPISTIIDDASEQINKAKTAYDAQNALHKAAIRIDKESHIKFGVQPTPAQFNDQKILNSIRDQIRGDLSHPDIWGDAAAHYGEITGSYKDYINASKNFQRTFMSKEVGPNGAKRFVVNPKKVGTFFSNFNGYGQDLPKQYLNDFFTTTQKLADSSENYTGFEKGADSIADHIQGLANKNEEIGKLASAIDQGSRGGEGEINDVGLKVLTSKALGIPDALTGVALGMNKAWKAIKNPYQTGAMLGNTYQKLKVIGDILQKSTDALERGTSGIFKNNLQRAIIAPAEESTSQAYDKHLDQIQKLSSDDHALMNHLDNTTQAMHEAAPNISAGLHGAIIKGVKFLDMKRPKPTQELPMNAPWEPSKSQKAQFNRYFKAIHKPLSVLNDVKQGTLSNESVEALQAVHPELYAEMKQSMIGHMQPKTMQKLNYATKISISKFMQQPMDSGLLPQNIQSNQLAMQMPVQSQQAPQSKPVRKSQAGLSKLDLSSRSLTETQQLQEDNA